MKVERIVLEGQLGAVNAAKVSFSKQAKEMGEKEYKLLDYLKKHKHNSPFFHPQICLQIAPFDLNDFSKTDIAGLEWYRNKDESRYDINNIRSSLFLYEKCKQYFSDKFIIEMDFGEGWLLEQHDLFSASRLPYMQFRIKCPMFVYNQLAKHQVGMVINSVSRRYVDYEPEFWYPEKMNNDYYGQYQFRKQSKDNKQGSIENEFINEYIEPVIDDYDDWITYDSIISSATTWYDLQIQNGICKEQARAILPMSMYTEFVWTGSLQDFARVCSLRLKKDSQKETRDVAQMIYDLCKKEYPNTFDKIISLHQ